MTAFNYKRNDNCINNNKTLEIITIMRCFPSFIPGTVTKYSGKKPLHLEIKGFILSYSFQSESIIWGSKGSSSISSHHTHHPEQSGINVQMIPCLSSGAQVNFFILMQFRAFMPRNDSTQSALCVATEINITQTYPQSNPM